MTGGDLGKYRNSTVVMERNYKKNLPIPVKIVAPSPDSFMRRRNTIVLESTPIVNVHAMSARGSSPPLNPNPFVDKCGMPSHIAR